MKNNKGFENESKIDIRLKLEKIKRHLEAAKEHLKALTNPKTVVAIHTQREEWTMEKKDLVQIIRENPGGVFIVDNDCWQYVSAQEKPGDEPLARSDEVVELGSGYGSGSNYGGDILQALAVIVGVKVESV